MAEANAGSESFERYGTKNCPLRSKLRFSEHRLATFDELPDGVSALPIDDLVSFGFFYSGDRLVFCLWCWAYYSLSSTAPSEHAISCPMHRLHGEINETSTFISRSGNPPALSLTLTETTQPITESTGKPSDFANLYSVLMYPFVNKVWNEPFGAVCAFVL